MQNNLNYKKYQKYKNKINFIKAVNLVTQKSKYIMEETRKYRSEIYGVITLDITFQYDGKGTGVMTDPEKNECFASWHSHPPLSVLTIPEDDIVFTPPSPADIYYAILGKILKKYDYSFIVSHEGIYIVTPLEKTVNFGEHELKELLHKNDPWLLPAEPIVNETGLIGVDFHGQEKLFPYFSELLHMTPNWNFDNLNSAVKHYIDQMENLHINIKFIPANKN